MHFGEMTMATTKAKPEKKTKNKKTKQVLEDIDTAICEIPKSPQLEIGDPL